MIETPRRNSDRRSAGNNARTAERSPEKKKATGQRELQCSRWEKRSKKTSSRYRVKGIRTRPAYKATLKKTRVLKA